MHRQTALQKLLFLIADGPVMFFIGVGFVPQFIITAVYPFGEALLKQMRDAVVAGFASSWARA